MVLPPTVLLTADFPLFHTPMLVAAAAEVKKPNLSAELEKHDGDRSWDPMAEVGEVRSHSTAVAGLLGDYRRQKHD